MRTDPLRTETELFCKNKKTTWEKEASHNINALWLVDLGTKQFPRTRTGHHHRGRNPRKSLKYEKLECTRSLHYTQLWLRKLTALH